MQLTIAYGIDVNFEKFEQINTLLGILKTF